jgi:uncharacterized zinc-type alcohol dehydrogenase-like protein
LQIHAHAAHGPRHDLVPFTYTAEPLGADQITIRISHCGICQSDVHLLDDHYGGMTRFPFVGGHELVGTVAEVGPAVRHLAVGQRVGVGPYRGACLHCDLCSHGRDNLCAKKQLTVVGHHGGFADAIRVDAGFAFPIPDEIPSAEAAPLLCAGLTVYAPLSRTTPEMRVGVMGVGGLGHLAIQFAARRGNHVTVVSTTPSKEADARALGAHDFVVSTDAAAVARAAGRLDLLLITSFGAVDWASILGLLGPGGRACLVGSSLTPIGIPAAMLITGQQAIEGSAAGSRAAMRDMLAFAARHGVRPQIERMPWARINEAVERVRRGDARYRVVLEG